LHLHEVYTGHFTVIGQCVRVTGVSEWVREFGLFWKLATFCSLESVSVYDQTGIGLAVHHYSLYSVVLAFMSCCLRFQMLMFAVRL